MRCRTIGEINSAEKLEALLWDVSKFRYTTETNIQKITTQKTPKVIYRVDCN
jgi:hypothetical protein